MRRNYRRGAVLLVLLPIAGATLAQEAPPSDATSPLRVLFIGSSLIYTNGLPQAVVRLSKQSSEARKIEAAEVTFPSWTLSRHWDAGKALKVIRSERWDFVVLQPASDVDLQQKATELFDAEIRKAGARTIVYVIWPRTDRGLMDSPDQYYARQEQVIKALGALSAPVGPAWTQAIQGGIAPSTLYNSDGRHPALAGTYLAAAVFFSVIYDKSPEGLVPLWTQSPNTSDWAVLTSVAWRAVQNAQQDVSHESTANPK